MASLDLPDNKKTYVIKAFEQSARARRQSHIRYFATGVTWTTTLLFGAAVPVADALGGPSSITALLGFGVVVSQTLQRLYLRVSKSSPVESLGREISREIRWLLYSEEMTVDLDGRFRTFFEAIERIRKEYDDQAVDHNRSLFTD